MFAKVTPDAAIVAVGTPDAVEPAFRAVRKAGVVCLFAGFDRGSVTPFDANLVQYKQTRPVGPQNLRDAIVQKLWRSSPAGRLIRRLSSHIVSRWRRMWKRSPLLAREPL